MSQKIAAIYENGLLHLLDNLDLPESNQVNLTIENPQNKKHLLL